MEAERRILWVFLLFLLKPEYSGRVRITDEGPAQAQRWLLDRVTRYFVSVLSMCFMSYFEAEL